MILAYFLDFLKAGYYVSRKTLMVQKDRYKQIKNQCPQNLAVVAGRIGPIGQRSGFSHVTTFANEMILA